MLSSKPFPLTVVLHNIRSAQNVGAILRTADAAAVSLFITTGYTPHLSEATDDPRPPHVRLANTRSIAKTALGAEQTVPCQHYPTLEAAVAFLRHNQYHIAALEQAESSTNLFDYAPAGPIALILGNEVTGLEPAELALCDVILELPMLGSKESLNVATAAGIALYQLRFRAKAV